MTKDITKELDKILSKAEVIEAIDDCAHQAIEDFRKTDKESMTIALPLKIFGDLPKEIKLCRLYILRANCEAQLERHTNSIQRLMSYDHAGTIQTYEDQKWQNHILYSEKHVELDKRWVTVEQGLWHRPVAGDQDWVTITFHTASADEIIDEYYQQPQTS